MKTSTLKPLTSLVIATLAILAAGSMRADNDPADDSVPGATTLSIDRAPAGTAVATGDVEYPGDFYDWYRITNSAGSASSKGFTKFVITVENQGAVGSSIVVELFRAPAASSGDIVSYSFANGGGTASITFDSPSDGAEYLIVVGLIGTTPAIPYTLRVDGSGATLKDTWSKYYAYGRSLYDYYLSIGSYELANGYYYLYYGYGEYYRYSALGNTKSAAGSYWWFFATFAYFYYAQFGDYASANDAYSQYVALSFQYLR